MVTLKEQEFDMVFDCQKVFKEVMNALARPGKIFFIGDSAAKLENEHKTLLAVALTFLDNGCKYFTSEKQEWSEEIRERTMAFGSDVEEADFLLIPRTDTETVNCSELFQRAKSGSLAEPHKSALFFIELDSLTQGEGLWLEGPGIKEKIQVNLPENGRMWLEEREKQEYEYPCGVELIFCTPEGEIMGIPRSVKTGGEQ